MSIISAIEKYKEKLQLKEATKDIYDLTEKDLSKPVYWKPKKRLTPRQRLEKEKAEKALNAIVSSEQTFQDNKKGKLYVSEEKETIVRKMINELFSRNDGVVSCQEVDRNIALLDMCNRTAHTVLLKMKRKGEIQRVRTSTQWVWLAKSRIKDFDYVHRAYNLLKDHPAGLTRDELQDKLGISKEVIVKKISKDIRFTYYKSESDNPKSRGKKLWILTK